MRRRLVDGVVGACAVLAALVGVRVAWATIEANTSWGAIPYEGMLEQNGTPVNGTRDFCFRIFKAAADANAIWTEQFTSVPVDAGRFSVRLGTTVPLTSDVEAAPNLFLQVAVADATMGGACGPASVGGHTALGGMQQLGASGFAVSAKQAVPNRDFLVTGKLGIGKAVPAATLDVVGSSSVTSNASVGGDLVVMGSTTVGGALDVGLGLRAGGSSAVTTCGAGAAGGEGTQRYNYSTHAMEFCNGSSWVSTAAQHFTEASIPIATGASTHSVAHGLGGTPSNVEVYLVCNIAEAGYSVGDHILASGTGYYASGDISRMSVWMNATQVGVSYTGSRLFVANKSSSAASFLTAANWTLTLHAWK